jgi:hypothetical protein
VAARRRIGCILERVVADAPVPLVSFSCLPARWRSFGGAGGAYATSWPYRPGPHGWAATMPRDGVVVWVFFPNVIPAVRYPPLRLVLPARPATLLEGARDTPEYRIHGRVRGRDVEVWVDVRRRHPTRALRRLAQRVVSGIRFG